MLYVYPKGGAHPLLGSAVATLDVQSCQCASWCFKTMNSTGHGALACPWGCAIIKTLAKLGVERLMQSG